MRQLKISQQITTRESESLEKYFQEISKMDLINTDEEVALARRIRDGDAVALEKLTKANLRFVVSVAKQYQNRGLSLNDLINEGNVGLIKAGQRFDETRGFKFISYAVWWIRQAITQALAEQPRMVRLPLNRIGLLSRMSRSSAALEQNFEREPTPQELADEIGTSVENVREMIQTSPKHISIDAPLLGTEDSILQDLLPDNKGKAPDANFNTSSLVIEIDRALATLTIRESEVLKMCYGLSGVRVHTLEEIATHFSVTRERVRQLREKATKDLRFTLRNHSIKDFVN